MLCAEFRRCRSGPCYKDEPDVEEMALASEADSDPVTRAKAAETDLQVRAGPRRMAADSEDEVAYSQPGGDVPTAVEIRRRLG